MQGHNDKPKLLEFSSTGIKLCFTSTFCNNLIMLNNYIVNFMRVHRIEELTF